ncbi:MAG: flagellar biosynthetic protein FliR [Candidatus Omnitrophica bacterium]|nr:flagellar biosynthetic protein FliR [Candidatus Omnitrophota bacterium]
MNDVDYTLLVDQFRLFMLIFVRISAMAVSAPVLSSALLRVPVQLIVGLVSALSLIVFSQLPPDTVLPDWGWAYALMIGGEVLMGVSLGFLVSLIIGGIQIGGEIIDHLIGFAVVDVIDPVTNESASLIGNLKGLLATLLFLLLHGHHHMFRGLMRTFEAVPPGAAGMPIAVWPFILGYSEALFSVGLQIAAPCLIVMTLIYVPEGFLARMVPQLNLMINDVPFRIAIGLFIVWLGLGPMMSVITRLIEEIAAASDHFALIAAGV